MNVSKNTNMPSFSGTVQMDKAKIARETAKVVKYNPENIAPEQRDALIGNMDALKERLEKFTPSECNFSLNLAVSTGNPVDMEPLKYGEAAIRRPDNYRFSDSAYKYRVDVKDLNNDDTESFSQFLSGERWSDYIPEVTGQQIWENGFKDFTEKVLKKYNGGTGRQDSADFNRFA